MLTAMESDSESKALVPAGDGAVPVPAGASDVVPAIIADAGARASRRYLEFFAVTIENANTRPANSCVANPSACFPTLRCRRRTASARHTDSQLRKPAGP
jgi:hypothetical protein